MVTLCWGSVADFIPAIPDPLTSVPLLFWTDSRLTQGRPGMNLMLLKVPPLSSPWPSGFVTSLRLKPPQQLG